MPNNYPEMPQDSVNERLKFLIESLNLSARAFSVTIGVPDSNTRNYLSKGTKLNSEYLESIASHFSHVNLGWLITGNGEPFLNNPQGSVAQTGKINQAGTRNKQMVTSNKGQANTDATQETKLNSALELASKEIALLREQLAMKDQLIAAKEEMLSLLRRQFNRPN